jgi:O-antigen ligase
MLFAGEFFSFSRAAWLSIAAGLLAGLLIAFLRFRAIHLLMLVIIAASILGYYSRDIYLYIEKVDAVSRQDDVGEHMQSVMNISTDASNLERINRWQCALRMFRDKPVVGFGPGSYMFVYGRYQVTTEMTRISTNHGEKGNAHSEYLMYLSEMGLVGLAIFLLMIYIAVSRAIRIFHRTDDKAVKWLILTLLIGFISYLFHGNFNSFIDTDKASVLFYGFLAVVVAVERFHTVENKPELKV